MRKLCLFILVLATASLCLAATSQNRVQAWLSQATVAQGVRHRNLVVYPIIAAEGKLPRVMTMDQALLAGTLKVTEVTDSGTVNTLTLSNKGSAPIFIMAGEILDGAKQDRVLQNDIWLPARSKKISADAFCVEQGRWSYESGSSKRFKSKATIANINVRAQASVNKDQSVVWSAVAETQSKAGYSAPTQSLNAAYEDKKVKAEVDSFIKAMKRLPRDNDKMMGVVVQVGDKIIAVDCFSRRDILLGLWPKMLKSYALEAVSESKTTAPLDRNKAERFLRYGTKAKMSKLPNPGMGTLLELKSSKINGTALVLQGGVAHLDLFRPVAKPDTGNVQIQRNSW